MRIHGTHVGLGKIWRVGKGGLIISEAGDTDILVGVFTFQTTDWNATSRSIRRRRSNGPDTTMSDEPDKQPEEESTEGVLKFLKRERDELKLHGWVYKFETGQVFTYDPQQVAYVPLETAAPAAVGQSRMLPAI